MPIKMITSFNFYRIKIILLVSCLCGLLLIAACSSLNYRSDSEKHGNKDFDGEVVKIDNMRYEEGKLEIKASRRDKK